MGKWNIRRPAKSRAQNIRFLIVSEGAITEIEYLNAIKRSRKISSADVEIIPPGPTSPKEIVQKARKLGIHARKSDPYDAIWCVFDVEAKVTQNARPGLADAIQLANANQIFIALSNPCFELWILLHEQDCTAWIYSNDVQRRCSTLNLVDGKSIYKVDEILQKYPAARQRAKALEAGHLCNGKQRPEDHNPSSSMYKLVEAIYEAFPSPS